MFVASPFPMTACIAKPSPEINGLVGIRIEFYAFGICISNTDGEQGLEPSRAAQRASR